MLRAQLDAGRLHVRDAGIDALRAGTTLLVVFHHTAITYGAIGAWYYKELPSDASLSSMLLVFFCTVNQAWFMGLFFLLAGYYTPGSLETQGNARYFAGRLKRLGIPLLVYGFVVGPATIAMAQTARGRPFGETLLGLWQRGEFEKGPLWFAWALLIFAAATVGLRSIGVPRFETGPRRGFPSNAALLLAALATGAAAFWLRLRWPVGTEVWGLQLGYFASYIVLFAAGCIASSPKLLEALPRSRVRTWRRVAWLSLPILPIVVLVGTSWGIQGRPEGGWSLPALVYAFWEPLVAWGVILALLQRSQSRFRELGPIGAKLARRAFTIFAIHPPVVVAVALAWRDVFAPPLVKFAVSASIASLLCYVLAGLLLKVPGVGRVL
jgi:surface polysaccharide O-acyltransferase-like enzyme